VRVSWWVALTRCCLINLGVDSLEQKLHGEPAELEDDCVCVCGCVGGVSERASERVSASESTAQTVHTTGAQVPQNDCSCRYVVGTSRVIDAHAHGRSLECV
jgi:hypothetical protein